jgi:TP901 family phage tail tape measure protein
MADVNANIGVNIDTSDALNQLKNLQRQISQFHQSVAKSSSAAGIAQRDLQKNFINSINSIQGFSAELRTVRTSAESFTNSLEKNKFSIQQYFRYAASQTKTFGKNFTSEFATIEKVAIERVKTLQTQYVKMGRDAQGAMQAIAIRPTVLNMKDLGTQTAIAAQKQVLFNQLIKQGSTNLLNFGKNTQWAGRQLMVGFTLPLATLGMTAGRVFMQMETAALKFKKVYGDLFTAPEETQQAMDAITELGLAYTKYGVAVADSLNVAAEAAAAGFAGVDLQNQTTAALRLSILGQMDLQEALQTTIALQNAFRISSQDLAGEIDFLNAVENQTVVSLQDITEATPRVATVIQALGGDVRDLAFFLAAMKEGGVNAAQGANALKSGLASLINPTERASELLMGMGINIRGIVSQNQGDLRGTVIGFAQALDRLDPMKRAQAIEQLFGKFQFARISALFDNVIRDGSQASRVLDLAGASLGELATLSDKELGVSAASAMNKFRASIEQVKVALAPIGELFLEIATPFIDFATGVLKAFNNLPDGIKKIIGTVITVVGGIGPVLLMTFGLVNNGIANMIKFFATVRLGYLKMTGQAKGIGDETQYMTQEQLEAAAAAASLDQAHAGLTQRFTAEKAAVDALRLAYQQAADAGARFATLNPGMMKPGSVAAPAKMAKGGVVSVGGRGNKDTQPALLTPGEAVIPAPMVKQYAPLIQGMISGNIPGYAQGVMLGMPKSAKSVSKSRDAAEEVYQMFLQSSYAGTPPTNYGHQISPSSGHSFPIFNLGGVYQKGNKQVFVKPVLDEKAALAEMRSTEISRRAHGLEAPEQRIVVIRDPMDTTRTRRFLALESDLDPKFVNNQPMGIFNEEQYFRQLVASLLRVDKDLSGSNVFGNVVADAGPAGVFNRASGIRDYEKNLPSMEDQALINLLGIRGGAKRAFAESTLGMMAGLTPQQYHQKMLAEIQKVLPRLKETIASFRLTDPTEVGVYDDMIRRLEEALGVDWSKFHAIHSAVKPAKPKAPTQAAPQNFANGGMVRGPGGPKDDAIPANLSNGEAVIDAATVKKNPAIISALFNKKRIKIPGYSESNGREFYSFGPDKDIELGGDVAEVRKILGELRNVTRLIDGMDDVLYQALVRLGKAINPTNLKKMLNEDPALALLRSPVVGKGRKTGSQGAVKMHDESGSIVVNVSDLRGVVSEATMEALVKSGETQVRLFKDMVFGGPAAANKGRLTGEEFASTLDENEGKDAFMRYVAEAGNIPPDHPELRRFAEAVRVKLLNAGTTVIGESEFGTIIQEALQEEIYAVGKNTTQVVKDAFTEAQRYSAISSTASSKSGAVGRDLKLLPNQTFSAGGQQIESIRRPTNYTGMQTPEADDIFFDNKTLEISKQRALAAGHEIGRIFAITAGEAAIAAARANSPSRETINASESLVDGVTTTIVDAKDDVAASVEQMLSPITDSKGRLIRRYTDDAEKQADINRRNQEVTQATQDSENIAAGKSREPRRIIREGDLETRLREQGDTSLVTEADKKRVGVFSNSLSRVSLVIGSVTGLMSMFGADLGGIAPVISMVSSALFTLSMVSQQLAGTKIAEAASGRALQVANAMGAKTMGDLFVKGAGLGGFLSNLGKGLGFALRFIGPIGIGLGSLAISFAALSQIAENQKAKIEGLGDTAFLTAEKMKLAGNLLGFTSKEVDFAASFTRPEGVTAEEATSAASLAADETFFKENFYGANILGAPIGITLTDTAVGFGKEIEAIKSATVEEAQLALQAIAIRTIATGGDAEAVAVLTGAILEAADRKEISLDVATNIDLATPEGQAKLSEVAEGASKLISDALSTGLTSQNQLNVDQQRVVEQAAGTYATLFAALRSGLDGGTISAETFNTEMAVMKAQLSEMDPAVLRVIGPAIAEKLGVSEIFDEINYGILTAEDRILALQAAAAGISIDTGDIKIITDGYGSATEDEITAMEEARERWRAGAEDNAIVVEETNILDALKTELDAINEKIRANEAQIEMADKLIAAGLDEADALAAVTDETWNNIFAKAQEADLIAGNTDATDMAIDSYNSLKESTENLTDAQNRASYADWKNGILEQNAALAQLEAAGVPTATAIEIVNDAGARSAAIAAANSGNLAAWLEEYKSIQAIASKLSFTGGGGKSPFQEAIDSLKEQQEEAKNSITSYAKLRSAGFRVAEASEIAKDSMLAAALASQQVGSAKWNQLVTAIRAAKAEEEAWLNTTPEGRAEQFAEVYGKVMDVFDAQEAILEMNNEAATATNRKIIETLEKQIEAYNRRASELQRDLDKIAEKESQINKAYDEKTKALEKVKKLNEDIINQQKSQLSIADALSKGDVSAAASAMQDARAQSALSRGDAMGIALDAAKQSELDALTENGKTRLQIEDEIKQIKKDVSAIEFGALQTARDAVEAADEALETAKENLTVQGKSKDEWENINTRIDASKASAALYEAEVLKALENARGLVGEWSKLQDTFTTTHVVNTVYNGTPSAIVPAPAPGSVPGALTYTPFGTGATAPGAINWKPYASGGYISGPGTPTSDSIPAMLSDGEYVIKAASVDKFGTGFLDSVNDGQLPKFKLGGPVNIRATERAAARTTSAKPVLTGRVSADAAERRALAAKPTTALGWVMASSQASTAANAAQAQQEAAAQRQRDALYQQGGFQGFEAGFGSTMNVVGQNPIVQAVGNYINNNAPIKSIIAALSIPVETIGAVAKNFIESGAKAYSQASQGDFIGAAGTMLLNSLTVMPKSLFEGTANAFSGVLDSNNARPSMFEQAGQAAYNANLFNAQNDPEMAALGRIIGGSLNIGADPLTYIGVGAVRSGLKAVLKNTPMGQASAIAQAAGIKPKIGFNVVERTEQAIVARETASIINNAAAELRRSKELTPREYGNMISMRENLVNSDRLSMGPKIPLQFPDMQKPLQSLTPQQIRDVAFYYGAQARGRNLISTNNLGPDRVGLSPFEMVTGNQRTRIKHINDFVDFLITRGFIPKLPGIKRVENQIQTGVSLNHPGLGIMPQAGPFAKILYGGKASAGPEIGSTAFASGYNFAFPLVSASLGGGRNNFLRSGRNKLVGPASTFISSKIAKEMDYVVVHEGKHAFDNISARIRPDSEILPSLLRARDETGNVLNAASEASGKAAEAILAKSTVHSYGRLDNFDPQELIPNFALNPDQVRNFLNTYLVPSASSSPPRWYQYGSDWVKLYRESISLNEKHYGIKIHDEATMDALQRAQEFLELSKFSIPHPTNGRANVASIIKAIADYDGMDQNFRVRAIDNLVQEAANLGIKLRVPRPSYAKGGLATNKFAMGGLVSPKYFAMGGLVSPKYFVNGGMAQGTDTVPAMLTPGEFVVNKKATDMYGPLLAAMNGSPAANLSMMGAKTFSEPVYSMPARDYADVGGNMGVYSKSNNSPSQTSLDNSVYNNYSLSVNVEGTNASANDIANVVMNKIKTIDSQQVRRQVLR